MPYQANFLRELEPFIQIELNNALPVLREYQLTPYDIVNLCGGVPGPDITSIRVELNSRRMVGGYGVRRVLPGSAISIWQTAILV